jgi:hypothetical protein
LLQVNRVPLRAIRSRETNEPNPGGIRRRRLPAVSALVVLAALVAAGKASAAGVTLVMQPNPVSAVPVAPAAGAQIAQQVNTVVQGAGAYAGTLQTQPTNVALPTIVSSPGATVTVFQGNSAGSGAAAGNSVVGQQTASQSQPAGNETSGSGSQGTVGQPQSTQEGAQTSQGAGAQATTVQNQPINIAIPIVINSPGSNTVIVQSNEAAAHAGAVNVSITTQATGQHQGTQLEFGPGQAGPFSSQANSGPNPTLAGNLSSVGAGIQEILNTVLQSNGSTWPWIWNWEWNWSGQLSIPGWTLPGPTTVKSPKPTESRRQEPVLDSFQPVIVSSNDGKLGGPLSSNFVQQRAKPEFKGSPLQPSAGSSAPGGSTGGPGFSPLTAVLGALLAVFLQLSSTAGFLGRRFRLSAAAWRRMACVAPLERPG